MKLIGKMFVRMPANRCKRWVHIYERATGGEIAQWMGPTDFTRKNPGWTAWWGNVDRKKEEFTFCKKEVGRRFVEEYFPQRNSYLKRAKIVLNDRKDDYIAMNSDDSEEAQAAFERFENKEYPFEQ